MLRELARETAATGPVQRLAAYTRSLRRRLRGRADSEHEQALTRVIVVTFMYLYMLWAPQPLGAAPVVFWWATGIFVAGLTASLAVAGHIVWRPAINPARRIVSLVVDALGITATMLVGGEAASIFYPLLLWIILGHGFRYGRAYLLIAAIICTGLFAVVISVSTTWRSTPYLDVALLISLVILPGYFAVLLSKLQVVLRRAEEASRAKGHFLATMSHELRTPLNAVIGMGDVLSSTKLDREQREMVSTIDAAARALLGLVEQVLDLARIEARQLVVEPEPFDLHELLAVVRHILAPTAAGKGLWLRLRLAPGTPWRLRGGARPLRQVLVNLVANAVKFTDEGGVTIEARTVGSLPGQLRLRFEVRDTGIGLSEASQARIFDRFTQAEETRKRSDAGAGLGLSIAKELIELMGGAIGVISRSGDGACFWLEVPLAEEPVQPEDGALPERGLVAICGEPAEGERALRRLSALGARCRLFSALPAAIRAMRQHEGPAVLVMVADTPSPDLRAAAGALTASSSIETIDLIGFGVADPERCALAALEPEASDQALVAALRAALSGPATGPAASRPVDAAASAPPPPPVRPLELLIAEDNRINQKVIARILERAGHRPTVVDDGEAVITCLADRAFDAILMDINLPGMSGIETINLIRFSMEANELPPVIALSADATPATRAACHDAGFAAYLTKPVDTALLVQTLASVTDSRRKPTASPAGATILSHPALISKRPVLDRGRLARLAELDSGDGFIEEVITGFIADAEGMAAELGRAGAAGDARGFRDIAHGLRSSAAHLGSVALFELCLSWRELDDEALIDRASLETARLNHELDRMKHELLDFQHDRERRAQPTAR